MLSSEKDLIQLSKLQQFSSYIPRPCYNDNETKSVVIISTDKGENKITPGVYQCNLETNEMKLLCKYPSNMMVNIDVCGQFIDYENELLYILSAYGQHYVMNLKTNQFPKELVMNWNINFYGRCIRAFNNILLYLYHGCP